MTSLTPLQYLGSFCPDCINRGPVFLFPVLLTFSKIYSNTIYQVGAIRFMICYHLITVVLVCFWTNCLWRRTIRLMYSSTFQLKMYITSDPKDSNISRHKCMLNLHSNFSTIWITWKFIK